VFQENAFQLDAFQTEEALPATAFQSDAFQLDAFQIESEALPATPARRRQRVTILLPPRRRILIPEEEWERDEEEREPDIAQALIPEKDATSLYNSSWIAAAPPQIAQAKMNQALREDEEVLLLL
jgi:hypothetical protein